MKTRIIMGSLAALALALPLSAFAASASIAGPTPGSTVPVGTQVTMSVNANGFNTPTYAISDSFSGSSIGPGTIGSGGVFTWTPNANDIGNHIITVNVGDGQGDAAEVTQTIFVTSAPAVTIDTLLPGPTANVGQNITFHINATNFGAPSYALSDAAATTTLVSTDITNSGYVSWTPVLSDAGQHAITATVTDPQGHSATATINVTIIAPTGVSSSAASNATALVGVPFTFTLTPSGMTDPVFSARDSFQNSTIGTSSISSDGAFSWTPQTKDIGGHTLTITASDAYAHVANVTLNVEVRANVSVGSTVTGTLSTSGSSNTQSTQPNASGLTSTQVQAILSLIESFGADASTIAKVQAALGGASSGGSSSSSATANFVSSLTLGSTGSEVTALQQKLTQLGFFSGDATGFFGSVTQAALKAFQSAHGLESVGSVGPLTRALLNQ